MVIAREVGWSDGLPNDDAFSKVRDSRPQRDLIDRRIRGLFDQRVACGIGNVYKCEVLFLHGLAPRTPAARVSDAQLVACWATARALMQENLALGGPRTTTAAHFREADAKAPSAKALKALRRRIPAHLRSWVYEREGEPCLRCRGPIAREVLGRDLRVTYWCPRCQPLEGAETPAGSG